MRMVEEHHGTSTTGLAEAADAFLRSLLLAAAGVALCIAGVIYFGDLRGQWRIGSGLALLGIVLIWRAWPGLLWWVRASERAAGNGLDWEDVGAERHRCACCGCPTLDSDTVGEPCLVCEWVEGDGDTYGHDVGLDEAKHNFRRNLSAFPPAERPEWSGPAPNPEVLKCKRALVQTYAAIARAEPEELSWLWMKAQEQESHLVKAELAQMDAGSTDPLD